MSAVMHPHKDSNRIITLFTVRAVRRSGDASNKGLNGDCPMSAVRHSHKDYNKDFNKDASEGCEAFL